MKNRLRAAVGIILSLLLLYWALRDVSFAEVMEHLRRANYWLLALSVVVMLSGFWIRAVRWGILLLPVSGPVAFRPRLAATFIGFGLNNLLPARIGEFARVYSLSRLTTVRIGSSLATLVIERLLDGFALIALLFLVVASPSFPAGDAGGMDVQSGALLAGLFMLAIGVFLGIAVAAPSFAEWVLKMAVRPFPERVSQAAMGALNSFLSGLAVLRNLKLFALSLILAAAQWTFLASSYYLCFLAFGVASIPFSGAIFLQSLISLAVAIPSSPGFFGPFEAGARIGMAIYGVPADQAISVAIGYHLGGFVPVSLIALYYIWRLDLSWSKMRAGKAHEPAPEGIPGDAGAPPAGAA